MTAKRDFLSNVRFKTKIVDGFDCTSKLHRILSTALPCSTLLSSALTVMLVLAGCGPKPLSVVSEVEIVLTGNSGVLVGDGWVLPGSSANLGATVTGTSGGKPVQRIVTRWEDYRVEVQGGSYVAESRTVRFSLDENAVSNQGYGVTIVHIKSGFRSEIRFKPDFARINGPDPKDLTSFDIFLDQSGFEVPQGTALIPGESYWLKAVAVDKMGRTFTTGDGDYPIPGTRIETSLTNFERIDGDKYSLETNEDVPDSTVQDIYRIEATYRDTGFTKSISYGYDPVIVRGPSPQSVSIFELEGALAIEELIEPGAVKELRVRVTDNSGRSWLTSMESKGSHADNEYPLPLSRIEVSVTNGSFDQYTQEVRFDENAKGMRGKTYALNVKYGDADRLIANKTYRPDFLSIVPFMIEDELLFKGQDGQKGRDGSGYVWSNHGKPGGGGVNGENGPDIQTMVQLVSTLDRAVRVVLFEVDIGFKRTYYVRRLDDVPMRIISRGGQGGQGGRGANGGGGEAGRNGTEGNANGGNGGTGGNGGNGGPGGFGGNGGSITLVLSTPELLSAFQVTSEGGSGGSGGLGGRGGSGGRGGNAFSNEVMEGKRGESGRVGKGGNWGSNGSTGNQGNVNVVPRGSGTDVANRAPEHLRSVLLY